MILFLSRELIRRHTSDAVFIRGRQAYKNGALLGYSIRHLDRCAEATIQSDEIEYRVHIQYSIETKQIKCSCSCKEPQMRSALCLHCVVALLETANQDEDGAFEDLPYIPADTKLLNAFKTSISIDHDTNEKQSAIVPLEQIITIGRSTFVEDDSLLSDDHNGMRMEVEYRSGISYRYLIRNARQFIVQVCENKPFELGKRFAYEPGHHDYSTSDRALLDFLYYSVAHYDRLNQNDCTLRGNKVLLSGVMLEKYLDHCTTDMKNVSLQSDRMREDIRFEQTDQADFCDFFICENNDSLIVDVKPYGTPLLSKNAHYVLVKNRLIRLSNNTARKVKIIKDHILREKQKQIMFHREQMNEFFLYVHPKLKIAGRVSLDPSLEKKLENNGLNMVVKLDTKQSHVLLYAQLEYGETVINLADDTFIAGNPSQYIIRNEEKESELVKHIDHYGFQKRQDHYVLKDSDKIYELITHGLADLQKICDIYYSEDFKRIRHKKPGFFKATLSKTVDWLEIRFTSDEIDTKELGKVLAALRQRKKYYQLKDGQFLDLNVEFATKFADMLEQIDFQKKDVEDDTLHIPVHRAFALDSMISDPALEEGLQVDSSFSDMIEKLQNYRLQDISVPASLEKVLRNYQTIGYKWLKTMSDNGFGTILADDMGLGKTLQLLSLLLANKESCTGSMKPALVIVPTSLVYNWISEIEKFTPQLCFQTVVGTPTQRNEALTHNPKPDVYLTTYSLIRRDYDLYESMSFSLCVLDESQHIKNPYSVGARAVKMLNAQVKIAMTGTPIENSITELWSIFDYIMPGYFGSIKKFRSRFHENGETNDEDLKTLHTLTSPFILRRMKSDVLPELPDKIITKMDSDLTAPQKELYLAYLEQAKEKFRKETNVQDRFAVLTALLRLRQICCHPGVFAENYTGGSGKLELFIEVVKDALSSQHRILVFSQFTRMLALIAKELDQEDIHYFYLDGDVPSGERLERVNRFNRGENEVFLISLKAGGYGLNLTGADVVIHYDPWWNPAVEEQATDRAHRIGQDKKVQVIKLVAKGTIEDKVLSLQETKKDLTNRIIRPNESFVDHLNMQEILSLLED